MDDEKASVIVAQMLFLSNADPRSDVHFYINSPGGSVSAVLVCWSRCAVKVRCSNRRKSCPGKGRPGRVAIPAAMEVTKWSKPGRKKAASGRLQVGRP